MDAENKELLDKIYNAYNTGKLSVFVMNELPVEKKLQELKKTEFLNEVKRLFSNDYDSKQIRKTVDFFWKENVLNRGKILENLDDGFRLFNDELVYQNPKTQNLFFLHGAFHIFKRGKSVYKITQQSEKALYQRIEEIVDDDKAKIICIFSDKNKKSEIDQEEYLTNGFNKLAELDGSIVILGSSFADNDSHIFTQIKNSKVKNVYISSFKKDIEKKLIQAKKWFSDKNIVFFDIYTIGYNK